jgi:hypothetical protein
MVNPSGEDFGDSITTVRFVGYCPYDFAVDTGAQVTTVEHLPGLRSAHEIEGANGVNGVATSARSDFAYLDLLQTGEHSVPSLLVVIQNLTQLKSADPRIRGILGENYLEHFDLLIDNRQHLLCLSTTPILASAVKGPHGLTRGSTLYAVPALLRLDFGSTAPVLYRADPLKSKLATSRTRQLKRVVNGVEQAFAILPPQDVQVAAQFIHQVSFVMPVNRVGNPLASREAACGQPWHSGEHSLAVAPTMQLSIRGDATRLLHWKRRETRKCLTIVPQRQHAEPIRERHGQLSSRLVFLPPVSPIPNG